MECGNRVKVKLGNGIMEVPGKIVGTSTDNTYSVYLDVGRVIHGLSAEDVRLDDIYMVNNLLDAVLEGKVENLKEAKRAKSIVEEMVE